MISCKPSTMKTAVPAPKALYQGDGSLNQCGKGNAQHDDERWEQGFVLTFRLPSGIHTG